MKRIVLILTNKIEGGIDSVISFLKKLNQDFYIIYPEDLLPLNSLTVGIKTGLRDTLFGNITLVGKSKIDLSRIKSVWYRRPKYPSVDTQISGMELFSNRESKSTLWSLYTTLDVLWVNHPFWGVRLLEDNKFYQLKIAKEVGLEIPDCVITNDAREARDFANQNDGQVALKAIYANVFETPEGPLFSYTQKIGAHEIPEEGLLSSPVMLQKYIPKKFELRVTVVGSKIFTCLLHSQEHQETKDDWRRNIDIIEHQEFNLPDMIASRILEMLKKLKLQYAAIDMIITPDDQYVFLEINPSGQWLWIEEKTRMPISEEIAKLLSTG